MSNLRQKMPRKSNKPLFITFEGGDGAGKTTLILSLKQRLEASGAKVISTREPGGTPVGEAIRSIVLNSGELKVVPKAELLLFLAARAAHVEEVILPALKSGAFVLCDRYNDSTIAYQGSARQLGVSEVTALCDYATGGLTPHLTFYLDLNPELGSERIRKMARAQDRFEKEKGSFSLKVREAFLQLAKESPDRIKVLDASQSPMTVVQEALCHLEKYCGSLTVPPSN